MDSVVGEPDLTVLHADWTPYSCGKGWGLVVWREFPEDRMGLQMGDGVCVKGGWVRESSP